ncbi:hypothetical protein ABZ671_25500 [Micromonospora sp. NPDC006766]|uniref:hypothetical protein n=1 Tax=Micromonospora sp. NPDC006766 TaxID=3154778 RepID=UPI00340A5FC5
MSDRNESAFRASTPRIVGYFLSIAAVSWLIAQLAVALIFRNPLDLLALGLSSVAFLLVFVGLSLLLNRKRWPWVRVTDGALELADRGRGVALPWPVVRSAVIRHSGPFAVLRVTLHPGVPAPPPGTLQPRVRAGHPTYQINVGTLRPSSVALRAALAHHLATAAPGVADARS